jgi:hypothetical protein
MKRLSLSVLLLSCFVLTGCPVFGGGGLLGSGEIGSPCETGANCADGLSCFRGVPGGYCTATCDDGCEAGSTCGDLGGSEFCLAACSGNGDCRDDYACVGGACRPTCNDRSDCGGASCQDGLCVANGVGAPCERPTDCDSGMVCASGLPDGYCTLDCSEITCPSGTECATYGGGSFCFDACTSDTQCRNGYVCSGGICNVPCTRDAECSGGQVCEAGRCAGAGVGDACDTGSDCEDGLTCYRGVSDGYCTASCESHEDCPVGSACGSMRGDLFCLAMCRDDIDCGTGQRCLGGMCTVPCTSDGDCAGEAFCDVNSGRCRGGLGGDVEYIDFGSIPSSQPIAFEVDASVHAISVVARGPVGITLYASQVINPAGVNLIGNDLFGPPLRVMPMEEAFTVQVPNSDSSQLEVTPGEWRVRIDAHNTSTTIDVTVILRRSTDGTAQDGSVPLDVFIAPGGFGAGVNASNAAQSAEVQAVFNRFRLFYETQAGIAIESITFHDLPASYSNITSATQYTDMFRDWSKDETINLFFVQSLSMWGSSAVAGVSGGIPGPPRFGGTGNSGVVVERQSTARLTGDCASHEVGHFVGLFHTTESNGRTHDLISDTPECPDLNSCQAGWRHLMFPGLTGVMDTMSRGSSVVVRANGGVN